MEIYFDNASTTKPFSFIIENGLETFKYNYANPSSLHDLGLKAELEIKNTSKILSRILNCSYNEIYYTSGGTESNNLAIFGSANKNRGNHIITTTVEHPSVIECFKELENNKFKTTYLSPDKNGNIDLNMLDQSITNETRLVSIMHVNNETGVINNLDSIGKVIKSKNPNTIFHVDAVQSFCKHEIDVQKSNIDLLSISSHKIHSLKGTGALYIKKGVRLKPLIYGGGQQNNIRPGTENSFGIFSFGQASEYAYRNIDTSYNKVHKIKNFITGEIIQMKDVHLNNFDVTSPYILNINFLGIKSEVMLHTLESEGIFVSSGSACSTKAKKSSILKQYDIPKEVYESSIRLSFSSQNTLEEAKYFIQVIRKIIPYLKKVL